MAMVVAAASGADEAGLFGRKRVGVEAGGSAVLPDNQVVTPAGDRIKVDGRLISSRLRPGGHTAVALTWQNFAGYISVLDIGTGKTLQQLHLGDHTVSFDGPTFSPDGHTVWVAQGSDILKLSVGNDGRLSGPVVIPTAGTSASPATPWIPSGMAFTPDGATAFVALNAINAVGVLDTSTNRFTSQIPVGNAPRQVVLAGRQAFVSNEGGRRATAGDPTNLSFGTRIVADPSTGAVTTGTVSVIDTTSRQVVDEVAVGLHPSALFTNGAQVMVANSNDDSLSVIEASSHKVVQTLNVNPLPQAPVGSAPNAIAMPDPGHVLVSLGRDNAIAVLGWHGATRPATFDGLIPTDWYPTGVEVDPVGHKIVVTSDKGIGSRGPLVTINQGPGTHPATGHNNYSDVGTLNLVASPSSRQLARYTRQVYDNNRWVGLANRNRPPAPGAAPVAIPAHLGEPSLIKHVFLIVKENRTYDQVFGDMARGNGDPALTQFGREVTPNQHALATEFPLLDNTYDSGTLSADGHNWLMQADAPDYVEKEFGNFIRSYPASGADALAYQKTGFIWNAVRRAGLSARNWGEYDNFLDGPAKKFGTWTDWYNDSLILEGKKAGALHVPVGTFHTRTDIPSLAAINEPDYPNFNLAIPDQYRADIFIRDLAGYEKQGTLPNFNMLWVPDDHTSGVAPGLPIPTAAVADNDLATGRIVDAISHSQFWKDSAIFVIEDDTQDGTDHVDGHRTNALVVSPYARRGAVIDTYYSQPDFVRTIEQILGTPTMNQMDLAAQPMRNVFTDTPDLRPFNFLANRIPLDQLGPAASATGGPAAAWAEWSAQQHFNALGTGQDEGNPQLLNRSVWYSTTGFLVPYPGDSRVLLPEEVPGSDVPARGVDG